MKHRSNTGRELIEKKIFHRKKLEKNIEKKHLCRPDKNFYYFCKSNAPVINLIVVSRNTKIKKKENKQKTMSL